MCYWTRAIDLQSEFRALRRMHSPAAHAPGAAPPGPTMLCVVALVVCLWFIFLFAPPPLLCWLASALFHMYYINQGRSQPTTDDSRIN